MAVISLSLHMAHTRQRTFSAYSSADPRHTHHRSLDAKKQNSHLRMRSESASSEAMSVRCVAYGKGAKASGGAVEKWDAARSARYQLHVGDGTE